MEKNKIFFIILGFFVVSVAGWYLLSPLFIVIESDEPLPGSALEKESLFSGNFVAAVHSVEGKVLIIEENGKKILRFENFETVNGPNLHIYLATDTSVKDFIDLGEIKATKGNVNYEIPAGTDLKKYNTVVVWCVPFRVLFSYAELKENEIQ